MADKRGSRTILVVGLGRFGSSLALELEDLGHEVLAVDTSEALVQRFAGGVAHAVSADATDPHALVSLGVGDLAHAVVGIGNDIEASILCTAAIADLGVPDIWAKAITEPHARILGRVGATHVVFPERDMGMRVAHQVTGQMIDFIQIDEDFALVETHPPSKEVGKTLMEAQLRQRYEVTVVSAKQPGGSFTYATPETVLAAGSILLVAGPKHSVEQFAATS